MRPTWHWPGTREAARRLRPATAIIALGAISYGFWPLWARLTGWAPSATSEVTEAAQLNPLLNAVATVAVLVYLFSPHLVLGAAASAGGAIKRPRWHRAWKYGVIAATIGVVLSGIWMLQPVSEYPDENMNPLILMFFPLWALLWWGPVCAAIGMALGWFSARNDPPSTSA